MLIVVVGFYDMSEKSIIYSEVTPEAVAEICVTLVGQGICPTYEIVRDYFQHHASPRLKVYLADWKNINESILPRGGTRVLIMKIQTLQNRVTQLEADLAGSTTTAG